MNGNIDGPRFERTRATKPSLPVSMRASGPEPAFDPEEYRADLADFGMTEEQESELLGILWSIMGHFARTGFHVDVCGLIFDDFNQAAEGKAVTDMIEHSSDMEMPSNGSGKERAT